MVMSSRQRLDSHSDDMIGLSFAVAFLGLTVQFLFDEGSCHAHIGWQIAWQLMAQMRFC